MTTPEAVEAAGEDCRLPQSLAEVVVLDSRHVPLKAAAADVDSRP